ncbi:MAG: single-stranded DNA-binding protein [Bacillota bacterium]|jgi:single-strand DNA-binding protein|nr:single-stranded DNA-binding protein [Bacillota bacterium]
MLNKVILIGRLSKDLELRYTKNGHATCNFTLACDRKMKDANGEKQADFIPVVVPPLRGKLAELCSQYLDKGKLVAVEGEIHIRSYDAQDGSKRWVTEVEAETVKFLSSKTNSSESQNSSLGQEVQYDPNDVPF